MNRYDSLTKRLQELHLGSPHLGSIGRSVEGRELWVVRLGRGDRRVLFTGALHAREWVASDLLLQLIETYAHDFPYPNLTFAVAPMLNPDGVVVAERQTDRRHKERQRSNARGVNLNRNFDAAWNTVGVDPEPDFTDGNYPGEAPFSEPETTALRDFITDFNPEVVVDWHCRGGLIDGFGGGERGHQLATLMAGVNGYRQVEEMHYEVSGTLSQWLRRDPQRIAINVEITTEEDPEWEQNGAAIAALLEELDRA